MPTIDITRPELIWPGKYDEKGNRVENRGTALPFQVIETIKEGRATREPGRMSDLFSYAAKQDENNWHNKLIWGDNLLVLASLMEEYAGKVDLIYIDPPFLKQEDFTIKVQLAEHTIEKSASVIEEKAYRDTWGKNHSSYLEMLYHRLRLARELLSETGSIFVHIGPDVSHYVRQILEEIFGTTCFLNEVIWQRTDPHNDAKSRFGNVHDTIFWFKKGEKQYYDYNAVRDELSDSGEKEYSLLELEDGSVINLKGNEHKKGRIFKLENATWKGNKNRFLWRGAKPSANREWMYDEQGMEDALNRGELYLRDSLKGSARCLVKYLDENLGIVLQDIWTNAGRMKGGSEYPTQKPERLLSQIIQSASPQHGLVLDFFGGSGTTAVASEKLGRRWIVCDLGRYAIHTTRKRLLDIPDSKPFEVLNLGKYERAYWQGITFGETPTEPNKAAIAAYIGFILELYKAQGLAGSHIHGKKGRALIHVGAVDAPVTINQVNEALAECATLGQKELHILGWEWEMGMNDPIIKHAQAEYGIGLRLLNIPREVMEKRAVECGDIRFFDLAYLEAEVKTGKEKRSIQVELKNFVIPDTDLIPDEVRDKITKWSDYIDYWAVDWDFRHDTFMNQWQTYRTRSQRKLDLVSDAHTYKEPGAYSILIKVVDIFGNDTNRLLEWEVK
ncbi:MAG: hypothetical protein A2X58_10930 [Nitrospirae bacterium GWC2_56_14]|nr:MAG: hypothetical protein A2X58_10930 [Nitrospirae bacterium GWC2_56_14]